MKRWTLRILFLLILGAVTTVGVAWGCVFLVNLDYVDRASGEGWGHWIQKGPYPWRMRVKRAFGSQRVEFDQFGPDIMNFFEMTEVDITPIVEPTLPVKVPSAHSIGQGPRTYEVRGWPRPAVWCQIEHGLRQRVRGGVNLAPEPRPGFWSGPIPIHPALPLRPILPGFIINTLFYAAIWFVLFFGVTSAKRTIRRKRGRCVRCGYDLRGQRSEVSDQRSGKHAGCPECGWNRAEAGA